jgi:vacuolar-type H+-ATPase subunit H
MIITLIILSFILGGYSLYLIKKSQKETNIYIDKKTNDLEIKLHEKSLYLLDELDNKIESNKKLILKELNKINQQNQKDNNEKHQQLISNEFKKLRSDMNKDLDDIVESVKNIKVF